MSNSGYGKPQYVYYRSAVVVARFLKGLLVVAVWVQVQDEKGRLSEPRLLLSTNTALQHLEVIRLYAKRWATEPMFNQMKHAWCLQQTWQQTRQVFWVQIRSLAYALPLLLAVRQEGKAQALISLTTWRLHQPVTAEYVRLGLQRSFRQVAVRNWWNPKSRKFKSPELADFEPLGKAA